MWYRIRSRHSCRLLENKVLSRFGPSLESKKFAVLVDVLGIRSPPLFFLLQQVNNVMEAYFSEKLFQSVMFPLLHWLQKIIQGCLTFVAVETRHKFACKRRAILPSTD